jgi:hypothetical protein
VLFTTGPARRMMSAPAEIFYFRRHLKQKTKSKGNIMAAKAKSKAKKPVKKAAPKKKVAAKKKK